MSKYIDIEQVVEEYRKSLEQNKSFVSMLQKLPSVEVVYCGECKYNGMGHCPMVWWDDGLQTLLNPCAADDFCSEGKRKDND